MTSIFDKDAKIFKKASCLERCSFLSLIPTNTQLNLTRQFASWYDDIIFYVFVYFHICVDYVNTISFVFKKIIILLKHLLYPRCLLPSKGHWDITKLTWTKTKAQNNDGRLNIEAAFCPSWNQFPVLQIIVINCFSLSVVKMCWNVDQFLFSL